MKSRNGYYHNRKVMPRIEPSKSIDFKVINYDYSGNKNFKKIFKYEPCGLYNLYDQLDGEINPAMMIGLLAVVLNKKSLNKRRNN